MMPIDSLNLNQNKTQIEKKWELAKRCRRRSKHHIRWLWLPSACRIMATKTTLTWWPCCYGHRKMSARWRLRSRGIETASRWIYYHVFRRLELRRLRADRYHHKLRTSLLSLRTPITCLKSRHQRFKSKNRRMGMGMRKKNKTKRQQIHIRRSTTSVSKSSSSMHLITQNLKVCQKTFCNIP